MKKNVIGKMEDFFGRIAVRIFVVMLLLVVPVNILVIFMNNFVMKSMREEINLSVESVLGNYATLVESRMQMGGNLLWRMIYENENGVAMLRQTDEEYYAFYKTRFYYDFLKMMELSDGLDAYFFLVRDRNDIVIWEEAMRELSAKQEFVRREYGSGGWEKGWSLKTINGREAACLYVELNNVTYGGWIYLDTMQRQLEQDVHYSTDVYTFTEEEGEDRADAIRISHRGGKKIFFINAYLDEEEIFGAVEAASVYIRLGSIITLFLFPVLYLVIRSLLIVPLKTLNGALKSVELGHLDYRITERANSLECRQSFAAFNAMADRIKSLKIENYEKELERDKMELKNLQLQIRPHFLLNTFNLLFALAKRHENGAIQEIILYLSDYFRYLFRSEKSLELFQREQELIEGYIRMVKIRYPDCVEIDYMYDTKIMLMRLPPLLLHNFVENVVKHVVKKGRLTRICIVGQYENKKVTFMVMDNGQGIGADKVSQVDAAMRQESFSGAYVGFSNSLKRIKYFYGDRADITISSVEGEGTCIILAIPYNLEEEHDTVDCE